jgi:Holliday junction resolvase
MKNEKDVKAKVKKLLDKFGWFWFMPPANAYGRSGISDIIALKAGVMLAIETKFGANKPTAMQVAFLNSVNAESAFAFVVNEGNLNWLEVFLEDFNSQTDLVATEGKMANDAGARLVDAIRALQALI